jgi:hypothetical protein
MKPAGSMGCNLERPRVGVSVDGAAVVGAATVIPRDSGEVVMFAIVRTLGVVGLCVLPLGAGVAQGATAVAAGGSAASGLSMAADQSGPRILGSIDISRHNSTIDIQAARVGSGGKLGPLKTLLTRQRKAGPYSFSVAPHGGPGPVTFEVVVTVRALHRSDFTATQDVTLTDS